MWILEDCCSLSKPAMDAKAEKVNDCEPLDLSRSLMRSRAIEREFFAIEREFFAIEREFFAIEREFFSRPLMSPFAIEREFFAIEREFFSRPLMSPFAIGREIIRSLMWSHATERDIIAIGRDIIRSLMWSHDAEAEKVKPSLMLSFDCEPLDLHSLMWSRPSVISSFAIEKEFFRPLMSSRDAEAEKVKSRSLMSSHKNEKPSMSRSLMSSQPFSFSFNDQEPSNKGGKDQLNGTGEEPVNKEGKNPGWDFLDAEAHIMRLTALAA